MNLVYNKRQQQQAIKVTAGKQPLMMRLDHRATLYILFPDRVLLYSLSKLGKGQQFIEDCIPIQLVKKELRGERDELSSAFEGKGVQSCQRVEQLIKERSIVLTRKPFRYLQARRKTLPSFSTLLVSQASLFPRAEPLLLLLLNDKTLLAIHRRWLTHFTYEWALCRPFAHEPIVQAELTRIPRREKECLVSVVSGERLTINSLSSKGESIERSVLWKTQIYQQVSVLKVSLCSKYNQFHVGIVTSNGTVVLTFSFLDKLILLKQSIVSSSPYFIDICSIKSEACDCILYAASLHALSATVLSSDISSFSPFAPSERVVGVIDGKWLLRNGRVLQRESQVQKIELFRVIGKEQSTNGYLRLFLGQSSFLSPNQFNLLIYGTELNQTKLIDSLLPLAKAPLLPLSLKDLLFLLRYQDKSKLLESGIKQLTGLLEKRRAGKQVAHEQVLLWLILLLNRIQQHPRFISYLKQEIQTINRLNGSKILNYLCDGQFDDRALAHCSNCKSVMHGQWVCEVCWHELKRQS